MAPWRRPSNGDRWGAKLTIECLFEPIEEIFTAAALLHNATEAHLAGNFQEAEQLFKRADDPVVWDFTDIAWGKRGRKHHKFVMSGNPPRLPLSSRPMPRMPTALIRHELLKRDGHHCRFCGVPVIDPQIRKLMSLQYPTAVGWGRTNNTQHAAFQCMWLQFDHILPNCRGGDSSLENMVITCAPCNFSRMDLTIEEVGLAHPLSHPTPVKWSGFAEWDGLERLRRTRKFP